MMPITQKTERYETPSAAKFAREKKTYPTDWVIQPSIRGSFYKLIHIPVMQDVRRCHVENRGR